MALRSAPLLVFALASVLFAASANAAINWTVSTPSTGPLDIGDQLVLDIGVTTTVPEAFVVSAVITPYDRSVIVPNFAASTIPDSIFDGICIPPSGPCFGGLDNNNQSGPDTPFEEDLGNGLWSLTFFQSLAISAASGDGTQDLRFPQFQIVFDVVGGGVSDLLIGSVEQYGGAYGAFTGDNVTNNAAITVVTPEPGTAMLVGLGLAGLTLGRARDRS